MSRNDNEPNQGPEIGPKYPWRGLSVDVARNFFTVDELVRVMDIVADLGMNRLHLHLSDDHAWRLEIPGWPALVERSAGPGVAGRSGYYSRRDWNELHRSATRRGLMLIPEIDLPGHSNAALHAIEGLNVDGITPPSYSGVDVGFSSLRMAAPDTAKFVKDVLRYVNDISDGLVHVGGDESHATQAAEYAELMGLILGTVREGGATPIAWQEAAEFLLPGEFVQAWDVRLDMAGVVDAAKRGVSVILSPASHVYLDIKYDEQTPYGQTWMDYNELQHAADWSPETIIPGIPSEQIAGVEATIWTETIRTFDELTYMVLPRLAVAAEMGQHGAINWPDFASRIPELGRQWSEQGIEFHRSPGVSWS